MSIALSTARASVYQLIRDVDRSEPGVKGYLVDQAISNHYQLVHARLHVPMAWTTIAVLSPNVATYTLSGGAAIEFHTMGLFRLTSTNRLLEKIGPAELEAFRQYITTQTGYPLALSVLEAQPTNVGTPETTFTLFPTPNAADTLQGLYAAVAGVVAADGDLIQLGQYAQRAIEYAAAVELLAGMTDQTAARLQVDRKTLASQYQKTSEQFIEWEQVRVSRERTSRMANRSHYRPRRY